MNCAYICNLKSRNAKKSYIKKVMLKLHTIYSSVDYFSTDNVYDTVYKIANDYDVIVFLGGDGTFNTIVNAVKDANADPIIGIIPKGTANDMARNLKLPRHINQAIKVIEKGNVENIYIHKINNSYFTYATALGKMSRVTCGTKYNTKPLGRFSYFIKGLFYLFSQKKFNVHIEFDDGRCDDFATRLLLIFNSYHIGTLRINPECDFNQGELDVIAIKGGYLKSIIYTLWFFVFGMHCKETPRHKYYRVSHLKVNTDANMPWCCDGELGPTGDVEFQRCVDTIRVYR